jgi:hypothetical protein
VDRHTLIGTGAAAETIEKHDDILISVRVQQGVAGKSQPAEFRVVEPFDHVRRGSDRRVVPECGEFEASRQ